MFRKAWETLFLTETSLWILGALAVVMALGSFTMAAESMNEMPLLRWMLANGPGATWWLWASVAIIVALAVNTIACSARSIIRKPANVRWPLLISPQIIHMGLIFMLLAHLISSWSSFKGTSMAQEGSMLGITRDLAIRLKHVDVTMSREGYPLDYSAKVDFLGSGGVMQSETISPNHPSFYDGFGVYLKSIEPADTGGINCLIEVHRDPGAPWALAGGVLFTLGTVLLFRLKILREQ